MTWALESLKDFHFNGLLMSKVYIDWAKKVQTNNRSWNWKGMQNLEMNRFVVSKLTQEIWQFLIWALKCLKNFHFNGLVLSKVYIVWAQKVQMSYLSWHWRAMQNLKEKWLVVWKKTWGFVKYSPEHLKVSKLELW